MNWIESTASGVSLYQARVSDLEKRVVAELWFKFLTLSKSYSSGRWDTIKVEVWADSGRVIIFPGVATKKDRDEDFCLEIHIRSLFDFWEQLSDSDIDDDAFDNQANTHIRSLIDILNDGLKKSLKSNSNLSPKRKLYVIFSNGSEAIVQNIV